MNKVFFIGNLTRDPEFTQTMDGVSCCKFGLAVNRKFSKNNEVDFFNIVVWRAQADNCSKYLKKGNKVAIVGSIQIRNYETKEGEKRQSVDITADEVEFLTPKGESGEGGGNYGGNSYGGGRKEVAELEPIEEDEDKLPF